MIGVYATHAWLPACSCPIFFGCAICAMAYRARVVRQVFSVRLTSLLQDGRFP